MRFHCFLSDQSKTGADEMTPINLAAELFSARINFRKAENYPSIAEFYAIHSQDSTIRSLSPSQIRI
jgi:hypothetical protein